MPAALPVGEVIAGLERFRLVRSLGRGASGAVYEVEDAQRSGARLALKVLASVSPHEIFALKEEFRGLQDVEHPNLLRLIELGNVHDVWFLVMELVDGIAPTHYTRPSRVSFDEGRLRAVFAQITRGLHALHSAGKVHRDIKPSNVLVDASGRVVILDFGLIRDAIVPGPEEDYLVGTLAYMAPEQAFREAVAPPADLYSLGVMLFECLTGRVPFDAPSLVDVTTQKVQGLQAPPRALAPSIPADLDDLAARLLDPEPARRPAADAILAVLEGRRASVPVPLQRTSEKRRVSFVGRAAELEALEVALDDVRRGQTVTVIIEGESGLGKTALERELIRRNEGSVVSIHGRCYEHEALPYKGIDGVMDSLADKLLARRASAPPIAPAVYARLSRVFPAFARTLSNGTSMAPPRDVDKTSTSRADLFAVVRSLIGMLALERTLIVAIDDWHWSDPDSVALLRDLLRPPDAPPILFLATMRPLLFEGEDSPLQLPGDVRRIRLERLSPTDSVRLAAALLGESGSPSAAQRVADDAAGNPLFLDELVRDNDHRRQTGAPALLDDVIRGRVVRLAPTSRALLEILCLAGVAIPLSLAGEVAGLAPGDLAVAAATLRAGHLARAAIVEGGEGAEPYHDRIREAVAGGLSPDEARTHHAALARALEKASWPDPEAIARHHIGAGEEARALRPLLLAADRAQDASAFALAARLYERALSLSALPDAERPPLAVKVATALSNAGLGIQAASAYERAAALAPRGEALALQRRAAEERLFAGEIDAGIEAAKRVLSAVKIAYPNGLVALVLGILWWRLLAALHRIRPVVAPSALRARSAERLDACTGVGYALAIVDPLRGAYFQGLSVLLTLRLGDARRLPEALALHATSVAAEGAHKSETVQALYAEARGLLGESQASGSWGFVEGCAGASAYLVGRFEECAALSEATLAWIAAHRPGNYWDLRTVQTARLWSLGYLGRLRELAADSERLRREADARGDLAAATGRRVGIINLAWLRTGESVRARRELQSAMAAWPQTGVNVTALWAMHGEGQIDLYEGTPDKALERLDALWGGFRRALVFQVEFSHIEARDLRGRAAIGAAAGAKGAKRRRLLARARRDAAFLGRLAGAHSRGFASAIEGGARELEGETARAVASYRAALAAFEEQGMQLAAAAMKRCIARLANEPLLERAALKYFEAEGVTDPHAMTRLMAPAFDAGPAGGAART